eukprot:7596402-Lingulodinium_polyedra.AAC.1
MRPGTHWRAGQPSARSPTFWVRTSVFGSWEVNGAVAEQVARCWVSWVSWAGVSDRAHFDLEREFARALC